ncbi:MAG: hypothetical protein EXX96DRAFT_535195 [Benjaminiella poitrasii]|nr:MAG: hypothetical protein EXX96DRAFT_535195 [Benjaminiella poitrasii]
MMMKKLNNFGKIKRRQTQIYDPGPFIPNREPTWKQRGSKRSVDETTAESSMSGAKRSRISDELLVRLLNALDNEIRQQLTGAIQQSILEEEDLEDLKLRLMEGQNFRVVLKSKERAIEPLQEEDSKHQMEESESEIAADQALQQ